MAAPSVTTPIRKLCMIPTQMMKKALTLMNLSGPTLTNPMTAFYISQCQCSTPCLLTTAPQSRPLHEWHCSNSLGVTQTITRGSHHGVPDKEDDIKKLTEQYVESKLHTHKNGRVVKAKDNAADFITLGGINMDCQIK